MLADGNADFTKRSASTSTSPARAWACAPSATRWSSITASSRRSMSKRPARSKSRAPTRSCKRSKLSDRAFAARDWAGCDTSSGQRVGALVLGMAGMARTQSQSTSCGSIAASSRCHRSTFLTGFLSAVFQPLRFQLRMPLRDAVAQILAVGMELTVARPLQRFERLDRRHQLHAVVGGRLGSPPNSSSHARRRAGSRPSRPARDCRCRRRR